MHFPLLPTLLATLLPSTTSAINILLNNDDGFGSANIRELYRVLVDAGHSVIMVAPATQQSAQGGRSVFTEYATLQQPSQYNLVPAGAPAVGQDPLNPDIWYYNGTPAACTFVALDWVIPQYYDNRTIDLLVSGPNFGTNLGPFVWTLSGTAGAAYSAVSRNLPAIAISAGNEGQRPYTQLNSTSDTPSGQPDPATLSATISLSLITTLINNTTPGSRLLPLGYGLNVNFATIDTLSPNPSCVTPTFFQTRFTGGALTDIAVRNATTGVFRYGEVETDGVNVCVNGDCDLPGETEVVDAGCYGSVSTFSIDYTGGGSVDGSVRAGIEGFAAFGVPEGVERVRRLGRRTSGEIGVKRRHD